MSRFKRGQIVRITRIDEGDDSGWLGFTAKVADTFIGETSTHLVAGGSHTKLIPLSERPDALYNYPDGGIDLLGWFFWPTKDLELVADLVDENS